jgi:4-diphosphocytidyl-2-C-methyl-D-erythritol kinase
MPIERTSPCKVNLLLNILGKRPDGFHELETLMHPVDVCDHLSFERAARGVELTCTEPALPNDARNIVVRAADAFLKCMSLGEGVRIRLEKRVPLAAGLGGGSSNAAATLLGLNALFGNPLEPERLRPIAASLGSDVPFFLQARPALATGRGEIIEPLEPCAALQGCAFLLVHPGFGISTPWAYQELARFPEAREGRPGRARLLAQRLGSGTLEEAGALFYNSLEAPAFSKYPILAVYQEFLRSRGARATLMSGSGSTTFALVKELSFAHALEEELRAKFGRCWTAVVPV